MEIKLWGVPALLFACALTPLPSTAAERCGLVEAECTEGPETRYIDGMAVTRSCWARKEYFACVNQDVHDNCGTAKAAGCSVIDSTCKQSVKYLYGGSECVATSFTYQCQATDAKTETGESCANKAYCMGDMCFDTSSPPSGDFKRAVTALEAGRQGGVYLDEGNLRLFTGSDERCSKSPLRNCCKTRAANSGSDKTLTNHSISKLYGAAGPDVGSKYMYDTLFEGKTPLSEMAGGKLNMSLAVFGVAALALPPVPPELLVDPHTLVLYLTLYAITDMASCSKSEVKLSSKRDKRLCVYVGDYCSHKIKIINVCTQRKETFCCFKSRLARILNEGAAIQLKTGWGTPQGPRCEGLSVADMQKIDLSQIDFTEFYEEIEPKALDAEGIINANSGKIDGLYKKGEQ